MGQEKFLEIGYVLRGPWCSNPRVEQQKETESKHKMKIYLKSFLLAPCICDTYFTHETCRFGENDFVTCVKVRIRNNLFDTFKDLEGLRQGDGLATLFFNIVLEKVIQESDVETIFR